MSQTYPPHRLTHPPTPAARSRLAPGLPFGSPAQELAMETPLAVQVAHAHKGFGGRPHNPLTRLHLEGGQATAAGPAPRTVALDDVSFEVRRGEIFGVLGPNGSGKTTLVRLIGSVLLPDGGHVSLFGHDLAAEPRAAQAFVNRVAAEASFFKKLSPVENLLYGARVIGSRPTEARQRVLDTLARLGLDPADYYRPMEVLSRGVQQKVTIARAFLSEPRLLLLDEPTTGLDPRARREVQAFIRALRDRHGTTVVLTTHDMVEAESLCDRVAILDHGRLVALDTPARLRQSLAQPGTDACETPSLEDAFLALTGRAARDEETKA
jgi:ABC-2 type transport system ATP-binding protein